MKFVKLKKDGSAIRLKLALGTQLEMSMNVNRILQFVLKLVETLSLMALKFVTMGTSSMGTDALRLVLLKKIGFAIPMNQQLALQLAMMDRLREMNNVTMEMT